MTASSAEPTRRDFLYIATGAVGAIGAAATLVPLVAQMNPDASTIAAGAPVEIDLSPITEGQIVKVFWRSKPIFIFHRAKKDIDAARGIGAESIGVGTAAFTAAQLREHGATYAFDDLTDPAALRALFAD